MSSPPAGAAGGSPEPNWYQDPSIPGYIRYWNGSSWMPGSSRPEPRSGEPVPAPPPGAVVAVPPPQVPSREETGPMFFDEDPLPPGPGVSADLPTALPELRRRGDLDRRSPREPAEDARPFPPEKAGGPGGVTAPQDPRGSFVRPPGSAPPHPALPVAGAAPVPGPWNAPAVPGAPDARVSDPHMSDQVLEAPGVPQARRAADLRPEPREQTMGIRRVEPSGEASWTRQVHELAHRAPTVRQDPAPAPSAPEPAPVAEPNPSGQEQPGARWQPEVPYPAQPYRPETPQPYRQAAHRPSPQPQGCPPAPERYRPEQWSPRTAGPASPRPAPAAPHGAVPPSAPAPWESSPFGSPEQTYPAGLGRRLLARLVDSLLPVAGAGAVAWLLADRAREHIRARIEAVEQAGVTQEIWLIDSTTGVHLALVIGTFLVLGLLYEALPTALWGRSAGKALLGLRVLRVESQEPPPLGAALSRWLVFGVLGVLAVGLLNVLWCVRDRPWRQCWHDKAAGTFVGGRSSGAPGAENP
ncbi:RDD family protein [Streptomyces sp. ACA25]|uniref:RDD family protein n=1 Tax=Streptomyces sp. ACA25 TaxID=3022596 RepID=UPI0023070036|nr:RDD family protein [Streptomyces sp. ACA25]MDB1089507.1 RDD family protein [Streptomyces sp. ACA25]